VDIETPRPVIDLDRVERNLVAMQAYCDAHGLRLRPHIKTHKMVAMARRQLALGAVGVTCQKLGEAEVMADAGIEDILISYPLVGDAKMRRLAALAGRSVKLTVAVDNAVARETVAQAADLASRTIGVYVEFDSGFARTGVRSAPEALELAGRIVEHPKLVFAGLMTHPASVAAVGFVHEARKLFAAAGIAIPLVSGGGTPGALRAHELGVLDELRVGTYIYNDRATVLAGAASLEDCALLVYVTVVSRPSDDLAIIDAGSKTLTSDGAGPNAVGYGLILEYPDAIIMRLSEEHGMVNLAGSLARPAVGDQLRIVPNHVCPVSNLHDSVTVERHGVVIGDWPVDARGMTR